MKRNRFARKTAWKRLQYVNPHESFVSHAMVKRYPPVDIFFLNQYR